MSRTVLALLADARLVTVTGTGGVGKTRLAVEIARAAGGRFVSLAATTDAARVPGVICDALDVARVPDEPDEQALDRALGREPTLLVVDNVEHLPDVAPLLAELLDRHPALTLLATSRQPVRIRAERLYPVAPLAPGSATSLFADRARARDPAFALTDENAPTVAAICERVAGLPLAIELAAARLGVLTPTDLAERLTGALGVLDHGPHDAPERQRTLRATLDWSYDLLDAQEQDAFTALAAFAGGCDLEAAEAVTGSPLPVLEGLVSKSLLIVRDARLTLLEPVRQYAAERLAARPDAHAVHVRHLAHFTALAERCERAIWGKKRSSPEFAILRRDHANLRVAVAWGLESGEERRVLALIAALGSYMRFGHRGAELRSWWDRAFREAGPRLPARLRARALLASGTNWQGNHDSADQIREAIALFRRLGDDAMIATGLAELAAYLNFVGDYGRGRAVSEEALVHARRAGDDVLIGIAQAGIALGTHDVAADLPLAREAAARLKAAGADERATEELSSLAFAALDEEAYELAVRLGTEALEAAVGIGDAWTLAFVNGNLGLATLLAGHLDAALAAFRDELKTAYENNLPTFVFEALLGLAALAAMDGEDLRAATLDAASRALADRPIAGSEVLVYARVEERFIQPARERLGEKAWSSARAAGSRMTAEAAQAFALEAVLLPD